MAGRRRHSQEELLLIPFLDILCSLIGVLVLIIVVVAVAQMQRSRGRSRQEVALAQKAQSLRAQLREQQNTDAKLRERLATLEAQQSLAKKLEELEKRRGSLAGQASELALLKKKQEEILAQIALLNASSEPLQKEIEALKKQIAQRKTNADVAPVQVRSFGSGAQGERPLAFIEANGAGLVVYKSAGANFRVAGATIGLDKDYNDFLAATKQKSPNTLVVFLIRKDGWWTYQRAAGWAEQNFILTTGKLPIPGEGPLDLSSFLK